MDPEVENLPPWQRPSSAPTTPCTPCYCKACAYHCMQCFLTKALGISYGRNRKRHRRTPEGLPNNQDPIQLKGRVILLFLHRSIPEPRRDQERPKKQKKEVAPEAVSDPCAI
uniref:Protein Tat n=1 Tax=Simian immunodeficiency virus TaxID=11723 RepID=A4UDH5_SIV|nr:tat protein [Simian immunodeficiency virus]